MVSLELTAKVASEGDVDGIGMYPVSVQKKRQTDLIGEEAKIQIHRQSPKNTGRTADGRRKTHWVTRRTGKERAHIKVITTSGKQTEEV